jgi:hypothetical protein
VGPPRRRQLCPRRRPSAPAVAEPEAVALLGDSQPREITVDTPTARIVFSNRGAQVLHWQLKKYRDTASELVDLVPIRRSGTEPHPFSLQADNARDSARLNTALYRVTGDTNGVFDVTKAKDRSCSSSRTRTAWRPARSSASTPRATR